MKELEVFVNWIPYPVVPLTLISRITQFRMVIFCKGTTPKRTLMPIAPFPPFAPNQIEFPLQSRSILLALSVKQVAFDVSVLNSSYCPEEEVAFVQLVSPIAADAEPIAKITSAKQKNPKRSLFSNMFPPLL